MCDNDGSNAIQLTHFEGPAVGSPRWSADGRQIAFDSSKEGNTDIYIIGAEGGAPRRLTTEASEDVRPSWSHDGRWIYFGSNRGGQWQVWKSPVRGGPAVRVTSAGGYEAYESPDGRFLYYGRFAVPGIWKVPVAGGPEEQVLAKGSVGGWIVTRQGICLLEPNSKGNLALHFFSFANGRLSEFVELAPGTRTRQGGSRIAVSPDGLRTLSVQVDQSESDILLVENFR